MRHWEHHRTRSKVALLLLINLVALLGGKYLALITIVKIELFGEAMAFAKAPKKKLPKAHLNRAQRGHSPPPAVTWTFPMLAGEYPRSRERLHVIRPGETLSEIADAYGLSVDALRRGNRLPPTGHPLVGETLRIPTTTGPQAIAESHQSSTTSEAALLLALQRHLDAPTPDTAQETPWLHLAGGGPTHLALWRARACDGGRRGTIPCGNRHQCPAGDSGTGGARRNGSVCGVQWSLRQSGQARPSKWLLNPVCP